MFLSKLVSTTLNVNNLIALTSKEWVTFITHINSNCIAFYSRFCLKFRATNTNNFHFVIIWMYVLLHNTHLFINYCYNSIYNLNCKVKTFSNLFIFFLSYTKKLKCYLIIILIYKNEKNRI